MKRELVNFPISFNVFQCDGMIFLPNSFIRYLSRAGSSVGNLSDSEINRTLPLPSKDSPCGLGIGVHEQTYNALWGVNE